MTDQPPPDFEQLRHQALRQPVSADHPALELLNTVPHVNGRALDLWGSDRDVADWLLRHGWHDAAMVAAAGDSGLLPAARALRETVRRLVTQRKLGEALDLAELNALLAQGESHLELVSDENGIRLLRRRRVSKPVHLLVPVAEAAAELLAEGDFDLIRKCEDPTCTLWFYDRTKSHRRRWCSMAACGNRNKVAAFRQRRQR